MSYTLKEDQGIPTILLIVMALATGFSVANCYYNQPLLDSITSDLSIPEYEGSIISAVTQLGYVIGLGLIIPMGEVISKKRIIIADYICCIISLLALSISKSLAIIKISSFVLGVSSVLPQFFIPMVALYSSPSKKTINVGIMQSCLLVGILASRFFSGLISEYLSWESVYLFAAIIMVLCLLSIAIVFPNTKVSFHQNYWETVKQMFSLLKHNRLLHVSTARAATAYASFFALWGCISFRMKESPFFASDDIIGCLGLCGLAGASAVLLISKYIPKIGSRRLSIIGAFVIILSWIIAFVFDGYYFGIIFPILIIDAGMQGIHLSDQTGIVTAHSNNVNCLNTLYMILYFIGGITGTISSGIMWSLFHWNGTILIGIFFAALSLAISFSIKE